MKNVPCDTWKVQLSRGMNMPSGCLNTEMTILISLCSCWSVDFSIIWVRRLKRKCFRDRNNPLAGIDRKLKRKILEKRSALGHRDDELFHECTVLMNQKRRSYEKICEVFRRTAAISEQCGSCRIFSSDRENPLKSQEGRFDG